MSCFECKGVGYKINKINVCNICDGKKCITCKETGYISFFQKIKKEN